MAAVRVGSGRVKYSDGSGGSGGPCQAVRAGQAVQAVHVEYFDRTKVIVSKNQIVVPPGNNVFDIFEGIGCQLRFQILNWMRRADPCFGVCRNSAWRRAMKELFRKLLKSGPPRRRSITRGPLRENYGTPRETTVARL